jgi:RNA polymerase sigma-70 factor (ECF subfamily)
MRRDHSTFAHSVSGADEAELMGRYCDGDAAAFRELYRQVSGPLLSYLLRLCNDRALAEDLLQQTFLKLHRARRAYVRGARPMPWLYAIAQRTFLDETRRQKRAREKVARSPEDVPEVAADFSGRPVEDADPPAYEQETLDAVMSAMKDLPENQREALILTKLSGMSIAQAAEVAGTTPGAMKLRAHRAKSALRKSLAVRGAAA